MKTLVLFIIICAIGTATFGYFYNVPKMENATIETNEFDIKRDYMQTCLPMTPIK